MELIPINNKTAVWGSAQGVMILLFF